VTDRFKHRATIVAEERTDRIDIGTMDGGFRAVTPGVEVKVEFSHGDHEQALTMLDAMVDRVKAQIADTVEGRSRG